jgi:hypothetical protein
MIFMKFSLNFVRTVSLFHVMYKIGDFTAVAMKNAVCWDVALSGSCNNLNVSPPSSG